MARMIQLKTLPCALLYTWTSQSFGHALDVWWLALRSIVVAVNL